MVPHVRNRGNGIVNVAVDTAYLQAKAGHAVTVAAEAGEYRDLLESAGVAFVEFKHPKSLADVLSVPLRFRRLVKSVAPEIVHAHVPTSAAIAGTFRFGYKYRLVASLHNEFQWSSILMAFADRIISVSSSSAVSLARRGVPKRKFRVVTNAPLGSPRCESEIFPSALSRPSIATVAGLTYRKGIDVLLDAFEIVHRSIPSAHLYIVGDGPDRKVFEQQADDLTSRANIHFLGFLPDPRASLKATDVFVLASRREPFGLAIIEARAAGCAIVASDVDGIPEALGGGTAGLLVAAGQPVELARALIDLLSDEKRLKRAKNIAAEGLDSYTVERLHRETLEVYATA